MGAAGDPLFGRHGIDELMSIDQSMHSLFGASKVAADVLVQEYGRYFGHENRLLSRRVPDRPRAFGSQLHGFLAYLAKCAVSRHALYRFRIQRQAGTR